jgi:hypothetical protein
MAQRGSRGVTLIFSLTSALDGALASLSAGKRTSTHFVGGWVGPRAGLDVCGKSRPQQDSIPGPFSP